MFRYGDMFTHENECDLLLVTANSTLNSQGILVAGKGAAGVLSLKYPKLLEAVSEQILKTTDRDNTYPDHIHVRTDYHLLVSPKWPDNPRAKVGLLQTKRWWQQSSPVDLVASSIKKLAGFANDHPMKTIFVNAPGMGEGRLDRSVVASLCETLPINVTVWAHKNQRPVKFDMRWMSAFEHVRYTMDLGEFLIGTGATTTDFFEIYTTLGSDPALRAHQWFVTRAYIESSRRGDADPLKSAFHIGLNEFNRYKIEKRSVEE